MKLKILFFPVALIVAVVLVIWIIKPELTVNKDKSKILESKKNDLENVIKKRQNIDSLINDLNSNTDKEKLVLSYLPTEKKEEEIINKSYKLASDEAGVVLTKVSISQGASRVGSVVNKTASKNNPILGQNIGTANTDTKLGDEMIQDLSLNMKSINTQLSVIGRYDNIREFLGYIYSMDSFNEINSISIASVQDTVETEGGSVSVETDDLSVEIDVNFNYFSPVLVSKNTELPVFTKTGFEFDIVDKLTEFITKKVADVETGITGKNNPFTSR